VLPPDKEPADEATPPAPSDPYGLSKALGESDAPHVINVRCSVIGPAPGRTGGLWQWFVGQEVDAEVPGYVDHVWTGVTSAQVAALCEDLAEIETFDRVRRSGANQHFVPNEPLSKFDLLRLLRDVLRPDLCIVPRTAGTPPARQLTTRDGLLTRSYHGDRGWTPDLVRTAAGVT
jgi:dTDP-4-dehydrorhamnose reductase